MRNLFIIIAVALIPLLGGCAHLSAEPTKAQVVDEAGQPLSGVVVVAYWELHQGSLTGHAMPCGAADVEESVTDKDGRFELPSWGPTWSSCDMPAFNPLLILFKPGYDPVQLINDSADSLQTVSVSHSIWDGKTITMRRYPDMDLSKVRAPSYATEFSGMNMNLMDFILNYPGECNWKKIPDMLRAIYLQQQQFKAAGNNLSTITTTMINIDESMQSHAPQCGSPKAFIEGLVK